MSAPRCPVQEIATFRAKLAEIEPPKRRTGPERGLAVLRRNKLRRAPAPNRKQRHRMAG